jgi:hypothetical protein
MNEVELVHIYAEDNRPQDDQDSQQSPQDASQKMGTGSLVHRSRPIQDEPGGEGEQEGEARIDQYEGPEVGLEPGDREHIAQDEGERHADHQAYHPGRKEGALDVEDRIATAGEEDQTGGFQAPKGDTHVSERIHYRPNASCVCGCG